MRASPASWVGLGPDGDDAPAAADDPGAEDGRSVGGGFDGEEDPVGDTAFLFVGVLLMTGKRFSDKEAGGVEGSRESRLSFLGNYLTTETLGRQPFFNPEQQPRRPGFC